MVREQIGKVFFDRQRIVLSSARAFALILAAVQIRLFPSGAAYPTPTPIFPGEPVLLVAGLYTFLKLLEPAKWRLKAPASIALLGIDVFMAASLFIVSGGIHSPFLLYTLAPVLSAALRLPARTTFFVASFTASYVLAVFITFAGDSFVQSISAMNDFPFYLTALVSAAVLPYLVNVYSRQRFQSSAILKERLRLAHEIHDGLCQGIYAMRWQLQRLQRDIENSQPLAATVQHMEKMLNEMEREARGSMELLSSFKIDRPFLLQIEERLRQLESDTGIKCRLETELPEPRLDRLVAAEAVHVCQEALQNAMKHSGARSIALKLGAPKGYLQITVADDGCGFDATRQTKWRGLMVMKERAESVGGRLRVTSAPGFGTRVQLEVPRL